ncbi:carbohydrate ABC transporter permease [Paenibacillus harenae]|uniref:carbohydrate ABC transporter permease n=1 Tax=Paenibacillus harenae TaxID=306543 RepID=UPI002793B183|nr:carbohydrate ABC transporter permease [Paenibacillus harenae]MDQ0059297.1 multiple sugar transport system permease protein [Paenibacillus harenae]
MDSSKRSGKRLPAAAASAAATAARWNDRHNPIEKAKHWLWVIVRTVLVTGICFVILYPILTKLSIALRDKQDMFDATVVWLPRHLTLENIQTVMDYLRYPEAVTNTLLLSIGTSLLQLVSCALAGYGFARLRFRGSGLLFGIVIFTIVVPPQTIMVPTYLHYRFFDVFGLYGLFTGSKGVNLLESFWPFFISSGLAMGLKNGLYIFIFRQFFRSLPKDLEEAAYVDGAGIPGTFVRVMLPNAAPGIATVLLFSFIWQWNDSYFVNLFAPNYTLLARMLDLLPGAVRPEYVGGISHTSLYLNTGILLGIMPIFILYLFAQKYFVESVERTGLVG